MAGKKILCKLQETIDLVKELKKENDMLLEENYVLKEQWAASELFHAHMKSLKFHTTKLQEYEKFIDETRKKHSESFDTINSTVILKKEELNAVEIKAEGKSTMKKDIDRMKTEVSKQKEQTQSEEQQIENDNLCHKNGPSCATPKRN